jgi:uncharacterized ParB-like nuclease family protein
LGSEAAAPPRDVVAPPFPHVRHGNGLEYRGATAMTRDIGKYLAAGLLGVAVLSLAAMTGAQAKQTFTGKITDDECPLANHDAMQMGPNDVECTIACVEVHGASYILYDGTHSYRLSDQQTPKKFAAQKVMVTGTLDSKTSTIHVDSIVAAK